MLLLQKKTGDEINYERESGRQRDYEVFMAMPRAIGHDRRGNDLHIRTPEGDLIEEEILTPVYRNAPDGSIVVERRREKRRKIHDELPSVVESFQQWVSNPERRAWLDG